MTTVQVHVRPVVLAAVVHLGLVASCGAAPVAVGASTDGLQRGLDLSADLSRALELTRGLTAALGQPDPADAIAALDEYIDGHLDEMRVIAAGARHAIDARAGDDRVAYEAALGAAMRDDVFAWHDAIDEFRTAHPDLRDQLDAQLDRLGTQYADQRLGEGEDDGD